MAALADAACDATEVEADAVENDAGGRRARCWRGFGGGGRGSRWNEPGGLRAADDTELIICCRARIPSFLGTH